MPARVDPLEVGCTDARCGADAGERCRRVGLGPLDKYHTKRILAAKRHARGWAPRTV